MAQEAGAGGGSSSAAGSICLFMRMLIGRTRYSASIGACSKVAQWQEVMYLLEELHASSLQTNAVVDHLAVVAYVRSTQQEEAVRLLHEIEFGLDFSVLALGGRGPGASELPPIAKLKVGVLSF